MPSYDQNLRLLGVYQIVVFRIPPQSKNSSSLPPSLSLSIQSNMSVVGIDFGLQHSVIAAAGRGGVDVILNGNSNRLNP
jgi:hypothetical protein